MKNLTFLFTALLLSKNGGSEMVQRVKVLDVEADDMNSVPKTHIVEGEHCFLHAVL